MDIYNVLVIMLSVGLLIVLALFIAILSLLYSIMRQVQRITVQAETMVENVGAASAFLKNGTSFSGIAHMMGSLVSKAMNKQKESKDGKK